MGEGNYSVIAKASPVAEQMLGEYRQNPSQKPVEAHKPSKPMCYPEAYYRSLVERTASYDLIPTPSLIAL